MNFNSLENKNPTAKSCSELLNEFEKIKTNKETTPRGVKLNLLGVGHRDVYNITPPFLIDGKVVMAARVETREDELKSEVCFFEQEDEVTWMKMDIPTLSLQDPFITKIDEEVVLGGVEVSLPESNSPIQYRTTFYKGKNFNSLEKFSTGPERMKDIRIIKLENGHIGVFARPQGEKYGRGKMAYIELENLEELTSKNILKAEVIEGLFAPGEWGGANQLHLLGNNKIGVIGHIACYDEKNNKNYYAMSFIFDITMHTASPVKIIATRADFPEGESKKNDLTNVIFVGGIEKKDGEYYLYAGLGDIESGKLPIEYPF